MPPQGASFTNMTIIVSFSRMYRGSGCITSSIDVRQVQNELDQHDCRVMEVNESRLQSWISALKWLKFQSNSSYRFLDIPIRWGNIASTYLVSRPPAGEAPYPQRYEPVSTNDVGVRTSCYNTPSTPLPEPH